MKRSIRQLVAGVVLLTVIAAAIVFLLHGPPLLKGGVHSWAALLTLMGLYAVAETAGIRFSAGRAGLSAASIPLLALVPLFGPSVGVAGTAVADLLVRIFLKRPLVKSIFNTAQLTLAAAVGSLVYALLGGPDAVSATGVFSLRETIFPFAGLATIYFFANAGLVATAVALDTEQPLVQVWREIAAVTLINDVASGSISLFVVFSFAELNVGGLLIVILPLLFVHHSYAVYLRLQRQNKEILELLVRTIEAKDPYTSGHSQRVSVLSNEIASRLECSAKEAEDIGTAGLLHDIGKIDFAYSDFIRRPTKLSSHEQDLIRSHPVRGAELLASISSLNKTVHDGVRHHHEHYDGGGYPDGLAGEGIPLAARIIMVADTVDAMLSTRPYRPALSVSDVIAELRRFAGKQFDPRIVDAFIKEGLVARAASRAGTETEGHDNGTVDTEGIHPESTGSSPVRAIQ